jgi:type IV pilus assembly protein PilM
MLNRLKDLISNKGGQGVAIELGPEKINVVQLKKQGADVKLLNLCSADVPAGVFEEGRIVNQAELADLIAATLKDNKISAKFVCTAVPMREAITRLIPLPAELSDAEMHDMVLNHEAALYLPYPREEVDIDYQKLELITDEDGLDKMQVMLAATRREITDSYIETFQRAGLAVKVLEINSFSLLRTMREQLRQFAPQEAVVLIDIEFDSTEIAIIVNGVPQFNRTVSIGTQQMLEALGSGMNLPSTRNSDILQGINIPDIPVSNITTVGDDETIGPGMDVLMRVLADLADEIRRSIDFYSNHSSNLRIEQLLLAGPGGGLGQLDLFFTQRLGVPATQIDPVASLGIETNLDIPLMQRPGLGIVLGLGMREVN